jgi:glycolate oxidase FAD binding subunit
VDREQAILEQVQAALADTRRLRIAGGGSKAFYTDQSGGELLDVSSHRGVVDYDPGELILHCRAGTPLEELRALLAENGQHLPFEPPAHGEAATIGGTVACGFSGPRRPWAGSLRDYLLGATLVNGHGHRLRFGGQVMKNVAGYDVSRLLAGSLGRLGVILDVSFKVLPLPASERTLEFVCDQGEAIRSIADWSAQPLPLSGAAWTDGTLTVRLSGAESEVAAAERRLAPDKATDDVAFWAELREHRLAFFSGDAPLWRLSVPAHVPALPLAGETFLDWGGAQRWYRGPEPAESLFEAAARVGGHARRFRGDGDGPRAAPLPPALAELHERIHRAFDPAGLFSAPGEEQ